MIKRHLEKKIELIPEESILEFKNPIELEYYLLESIDSDFEGLEGIKVYGIEIVKRVNDENVENKAVRNFSCCRESAKKILDRLAVNTVTPVGLPFVLDDILGT